MLSLNKKEDLTKYLSQFKKKKNLYTFFKAAFTQIADYMNCNEETEFK